MLELGRRAAVPDLVTAVTDVSLHRDLPGATSLEVASERVLDAFDAMCFADVVIGSKSGFTALAAHLCEAPLFIPMPFVVGYSYVPNVLVLTEKHTTLGTTFSKFGNPTAARTRIADEYYLDESLLSRKLTEDPAQSWCGTKS